ncbi:MAG: VOC family protein [Opitutaceae bacterium]
MLGRHKRFSYDRVFGFGWLTGLVSAVVLGFVLSGCSVNKPPVLPALMVDAGAASQAGRIVWRDLFVADIDRVRPFYESLFGWEFDASVDYGNFQLARLDGRPVAGFVLMDEDRTRDVTTQWVPNLLVEDVDAVAARFADGGTVLRAPVDLPDRGRVAVVEDAEEAPVLLLETRNGTPTPPTGAPGTFFWTELWSADEAISLPFYEQTVGYRRVPTPEGIDPSYRIIGVGGERQAGLVVIPYDGVRPHWLSYIAVDDPSAIAERAVALGGRVLIAPDETNGRVAAVLADPGGGVFGIQQWPLQTEEEVQP